jgi:hypothetical protein
MVTEEKGKVVWITGFPYYLCLVSLFHFSSRFPPISRPFPPPNSPPIFLRYFLQFSNQLLNNQIRSLREPSPHSPTPAPVQGRVQMHIAHVLGHAPAAGQASRSGLHRLGLSLIQVNEKSKKCKPTLTLTITLILISNPTQTLDV